MGAKPAKTSTKRTKKKKTGAVSKIDGRTLRGLLKSREDTPFIRPLNPEEVLKMDLVSNPPTNFPNLTPLQSAFVKRRIEQPNEPLESTSKAVGASISTRPWATKGVSLYLVAVTSYLPIPQSPVDLRRSAVESLVQVMQAAPKPGDRVNAARVLVMYLPPVPKDDDDGDDASDLDAIELRRQLETALSALNDHTIHLAQPVTLPGVVVSEPTTVPTEGTEAVSSPSSPLLDRVIEAGGGVVLEDDAGASSKGAAPPKTDSLRLLDPSPDFFKNPREESDGDTAE